MKWTFIPGETEREFTARIHREEMESWDRLVVKTNASIEAARRRDGAPEVNLAGSARDVVENLVENAANRYRRNRFFLDAISLGLSHSRPERIIAVCKHKLEFGQRDPMGVGSGAVRLINLRGAVRYAQQLLAGDTIVEAAE